MQEGIAKPANATRLSRAATPLRIFLRRTLDVALPTLCPACREPVGGNGLRVGGDGFRPATGPDINMGWHMDKMSQARLQISQSIGWRDSFFRMRRRFQCVNVKMQGQRMIGSLS